MKGIKITNIHEEPFLCPSKFAMIGEIVAIATSICVGIAQKNTTISIGLPVLLAIFLGITYLVYKIDKFMRESKECFVQIGQMAEYDDIKEFHTKYKVISDLGDGRYLASKRTRNEIDKREVRS